MEQSLGKRGRGPVLVNLFVYSFPPTPNKYKLSNSRVPDTAQTDEVEGAQLLTVWFRRQTWTKLQYSVLSALRAICTGLHEDGCDPVCLGVWGKPGKWDRKWDCGAESSRRETVLQEDVRVGRREGPSRKRKHCISKRVSMGLEQLLCWRW